MIYTKSQKIKNAYRAYQKSTVTRLEDVYGTYSPAKANALAWVKAVSANLCGTTPYILTYNAFTFTAGFFGEYHGEEVFVYVTSTHIYYCNSADLD